MSKKIVVSGMRPTGSLHLGNYFGALANWIELQNKEECYFFVADWHALTTGYEDTSNLKNNRYELVADWIAAGLDPEKCVIFSQAEVKEHAELHLLLSMVTPLSWLERCPTYKDQLQNLKHKNITTYGFLGYPCLMSSDILLYKATAVPVGEDQLPHIELTREIGRRFNSLFGEVFPEAESMLTKAKVLIGLDGRKMSKSYNNTIALADSPEVLMQKTRQMVTDPARIKKDDPGHPDICSVYMMHKVFNEDEVGQIEQDCKGGCIGCVKCKKHLNEKMTEVMQPIYEKRTKLLEDVSAIDEILHEGNKKARARAQETMAEVREAMKIDFK